MSAQAIWLTTLLPGMVLLARWRPAALGCGAIASLAVSFVVSTALATPIFFVAYFTEAPVNLVATAWIVGVAAAVALGARKRERSRIVRSMRRGFRLESGIVIGFCAVPLVAGGCVSNDILMHAAKVLAIRDHGFSLVDPYSPIGVWETKHMVSAVHAYHAMFSELAGQPPLEFFYASAWFVVLLVAGAAEFLTVSIFRSRRAGRLAAVIACPLGLSLQHVLLPNNLASFVVFPILLGLSWRWLARGRRGDLQLMALCSMTMGVLHVAVSALTPLLLVPMAIGSALRPISSWRRAALLPLGLAPAWPPVLLTALQPNHFREQLESIRTKVQFDVHVAGLDFWIINPRHCEWMLAAVPALLVAAALRRPARGRFLWLASVVLLAAAWMLNPIQVYLLDLIVPPWVVRRLNWMAMSVAVIAFAALLAPLHRRASNTPLRLSLALLILIAGSLVVRHRMSRYFERRPLESAWLRHAQLIESVIAPVVPRDAMVAADPMTSLLLPAVMPLTVLAQNRGHANPADEDWIRRDGVRRELFAPDTSTERRRELCRQEQIDFIVLDPWPQLASQRPASDGTPFEHWPVAARHEDVLVLHADPAPRQ